MPPRPPRQRDFREPGSLPRWRIGVGAAVVAVLVVSAVGVVLTAVSRAGSATSSVRPGDSLPSAASSSASHDRASPGPGLFVHITGRVKHAGLYELDAGSRAVDVVTAAGGFEADADQGALNLARPVSDGEQIVVPAVGEAPAAPSSGSAGGAPSGGGPSGGGASGGTVNLNTADQAALETLNGVGPATATAILAWRDEHGRFESVEDLLDVTGIGEKKLEKLRDGVAVR